jgi:hypothetical protein
MYQVQIIGSNLPSETAMFESLKQDMREKLLPEIANIVRKRIQDKINAFQFKHSKGMMASAVRIQLNPKQLEVIIYNDNTIAPWAIYQEKGVKKRPMNWLIGKTIPYTIMGGKFSFAKGNPKAQFARVTAENIGKINPKTGKPRWVHPGYPGKYFYRDGLKEAVEEIRSHFKVFTFKIVEAA